MARRSARRPGCPRLRAGSLRGTTSMGGASSAPTASEGAISARQRWRHTTARAPNNNLRRLRPAVRCCARPASVVRPATCFSTTRPDLGRRNGLATCLASAEAGASRIGALAACRALNRYYGAPFATAPLPPRSASLRRASARLGWLRSSEPARHANCAPRYAIHRAVGLARQRYALQAASARRPRPSPKGVSGRLKPGRSTDRTPGAG